MNTVLFYDSETTGLPLFNQPSEDPRQPYITQLAAELVNEDTGEVLAHFNALIKPEGWTIPDEVAKITGITTEKAEAYGIPMAQVLPVFLKMWRNASVHRVAHNEAFDMRMVRIALKRGGGILPSLAEEWKEGPAFCTCSSSLKIVNLPPTERMIAAGRRGPKQPTMSEAYKHFTGKDLDGAHNAAVDIMACKTVYFALQALQQPAAA